MTNGLRKKIVKSFFWVFIDSIGQRLLQFVVSIILARLLLPDEFGLIAMVSVFIVFSGVFIDSGFSFALIRKKNVTSTELDTVFWFNLIISLLIYAILWLSSSSIAKFYDQPILESIVKVISINLIIKAASGIQNINLQRDLRFKELAIVGLISKITSGAVAIFFAYRGFGVWSLVLQELLANFLRTIMFFFSTSTYPKSGFQHQHSKIFLILARSCFMLAL